MSKGLKITLVVLIIAIVLGLAGFLVFYLLSGKGSIEEQQSLTSRLDTPTNLALDSDLTLKFDKVPNAVSYLIYVNGIEKKTVTNNQATWEELFGPNAKKYGKYEFQVKALYTDADYHSKLSEPFVFERTLSLSNVAAYSWVGDTEFTWEEVPDALSYTIVVYTMREVDGVENFSRLITTKTDSLKFNLTRLIDVTDEAYQDVKYFEIHIMASATDVNNEGGDEYVTDSSENLITEPLQYYLTQTLPAPQISLVDIKEQAESMLLSWRKITHEKLAGYEVYLDGELLTKLDASATQLELNDFKQADTLGTHYLYMLAVPETSDKNVRVRGSKSEECSYRVVHHLGFVDASKIAIIKENAYLKVTWPSVEEKVTRSYIENGVSQTIEYSYRATSYTVEFWASETENGDYTLRYSVDTPLNVLSTELNNFREYSTNNGFVRVRIKANYDSVSDERNYIIGNSYDEDSVKISSACMIVSTLDDVTELSIQNYIFSWRAVKNAVDYTVRLYKIENGVSTLWENATDPDITLLDNHYKVDLKSWFIKLNAEPILYGVTVQALGDNVFYRASTESVQLAVEYSVKLNAPTFSEKQKLSNGELYLKWNTVPGANSYQVLIQTQTQKESGNGVLVDTECVSAEFTSTDFATILTTPTKLFVNVRAKYDASLNNDKELFYTPSDFTEDEFNYTIKYSTPTNISATTNNDLNSIRVTWNHVSEYNSGYSQDLMYLVRVANARGDSIEKSLKKDVATNTLSNSCNFSSTELKNIGVGKLNISVKAAKDTNYVSLYEEGDYGVLENYVYNYTLHDTDAAALNPEVLADTTNKKVIITANFSEVAHVNYYKLVFATEGTDASNIIYLDVTKEQRVVVDDAIKYTITSDPTITERVKVVSIEIPMDDRFNSALLPLYAVTKIEFFFFEKELWHI